MNDENVVIEIKKMVKIVEDNTHNNEVMDMFGRLYIKLMTYPLEHLSPTTRSLYSFYGDTEQFMGDTMTALLDYLVNGVNKPYLDTPPSVKSILWISTNILMLNEKEQKTAFKVEMNNLLKNMKNESIGE